jgi:hypothetical protein
MNRIELEALMKAPADTLVPWGPNGQVITVGEALKHVLRGDGMEVTPAAPAPGQPGHQAGPNIRISQEAVNALSEAQYQELKATGHLQGVTNSDNGRAVVHVSRGGSHSVNLSFDPETGKVGPGRGLDLRDFSDPTAGSK